MFVAMPPCFRMVVPLVCLLCLSLTVGGVALAKDAAGPRSPKLSDASAEVVEFVNGRIKQAWTDNEIRPSSPADDAEWLRRVYLDVVGHVPPADVVEPFLASKDKTKRLQLIEVLLDDPAYASCWTTIWTNLMIGRETPRRTSRTALEGFLREAFESNRPWNDIVYELMTAEGHYEENGAVNYLLSQMTSRDDGIQATAKTARLFLGMQVQCTQCHNHPFNRWEQEQFWQLNSFFRQARRIDHRRFDDTRNRLVDDYSELVTEDFSGAVFFEQRNGLMRVAYPTFFGTPVEVSEGTNRRLILGKMMAQGEQPPIAPAMVNRMWSHFFGYGLTNPVDDMGPHNSPSHPDVLNRLTEAFIASGFDQKELIRVICSTEAYQLSSQFDQGNAADNPANGEMPLFSHMYLKSLEPEQLYDSLMVASRNQLPGRMDWDEEQAAKRAWLSQFVITSDTDENSESTTFNGTVPQSLMMMNGDLIQKAISLEKGSYLASALFDSRTNDPEKIRRLFLATLCRNPNRAERAQALDMMRQNPNKLIAYQDLFWALLNSNEFIINH